MILCTHKIKYKVKLGVYEKIQFLWKCEKICKIHNAPLHTFGSFIAISLRKISFAGVLWSMEIWLVIIEKNIKNSNDGDFSGVEKWCKNDNMRVPLLSDLFLCDES